MKLRYLTAGESHGKALVGILEGMPAGLPMTGAYLQAHMQRRKKGYGRGARQKIETDTAEILSGVRHGKTLGSPIALLVKNRDWENWRDIMQSEPFRGKAARRVEVPRPGHADLIGGLKYGHADMRNVLERASARETAMRVALGTLARRFLEELGVAVASRLIRVGSVEDKNPLRLPVEKLNQKADASPLRCLDKKVESAMKREVDAAQKAGDTLGGVFEVYASGLPAGLGSYVHWDRRLEGDIAKAFMSLNAIKGVEIGLGFALGALRGSCAHDEFFRDAKKRKIFRKTNRSGGVDGGMTTGQTVVVRAVMKPLATLMRPVRSVNLKTQKEVKAHIERSDVCSVPSAAVIGESLLALVMADAVLECFGGDSMKDLKARVRARKKNLLLR